MKKIALSLLASFALVQSAYGATSPLAESLLEYEAITNFIGGPSFTVIPSDEFIVDIKRLTKRIDTLGEVRYKIVTREPWLPPIVAMLDADHHHSSSDCHHRHHHKHHDTNIYIATLLVTPNPGIGPNIVTVLAIVPVSH